MGILSGTVSIRLDHLVVDESDEDSAVESALSTIRSQIRNSGMCDPWRQALQIDSVDIDDVEFEASYQTANVTVSSSWTGEVRYDPRNTDIYAWLRDNVETIVVEQIDTDWSVNDEDSHEDGNEDYDAEDGDLVPASAALQRRIDSLEAVRREYEATVTRLRADVADLRSGNARLRDDLTTTVYTLSGYAAEENTSKAASNGDTA